MNLDKYNMDKTSLEKPASDKSMMWIIAFGIVTAILWNVPFGTLILYPFTILGTWFHEMGHGLAAIIMGGNFLRLELFPNGSGLAYFSGSYSALQKWFIASMGPLGPTVVGSLFIAASVNKTVTRILIYLFSLALIVSTVLWLRPWFGIGFFIVLIFAVFITFIAIRGKDSVLKGTLQFIGVQALASLYTNIGYLFISSGTIEGRQQLSDTQVMAQELFLPHWFWGGFLIFVSVFLAYLSIKFVFDFHNKKPKVSESII